MHQIAIEFFTASIASRSLKVVVVVVGVVAGVVILLVGTRSEIRDICTSTMVQELYRKVRDSAFTHSLNKYRNQVL